MIFRSCDPLRLIFFIPFIPNTKSTINRYTMAAASTPSPESLLISEEPKIDAALKSFYSWWIATKQQEQQTQVLTNKRLSDPPLWTPSMALACTRCLSKAINGHVMAMKITKEEAMVEDNAPSSSSSSSTPAQRRALVERVWNQQAGTPGTKITKTLGRLSLSIAWDDKDLKDAVTKLFLAEQASSDEPFLMEYLIVFERLLKMDPAENGDAALIWSKDKGQAELARRAAERQTQAEERLQQEEERNTQPSEEAELPRIEEIKDDE